MDKISSLLSILSSLVELFTKFWDKLVFKRNLQKESKRAKQQVSVSEEEKSSYYFKDYKKHITIYPNGNGIIINTATVVITDKKNITCIYRKLNIEDGKKDSKFPPIADMMRQTKQNRFDKFGFWYCCDDDIISGVDEWYWSDTDPMVEDERIKKNPKEIRWRFHFNEGKIVEGKEYKIKYVVSVEGLYPIENGKLNPVLANDPNSVRGCNSTVVILQEMKNFTYVVSFEKGIKLEILPQCEVCRPLDRRNRPISGNKCNDIFYDKYVYDVEEPQLDSKVRVRWCFQEMEG